jgi:hypothetical protein
MTTVDGRLPPVVSLHRDAALLSLLLAACGTTKLPVDSQSDDSSGRSTSSDSSTSTETSTIGPGVTFVPMTDQVLLPDCDSYAQNCPDGEKCVPYASTGGTWDAFKCVPVTGEQATGEPCSYGGTVEATDDCDENGGCWNVKEVDGELVGTCHAFCTGTPDNPECAEGTSCWVSASGIPAYCFYTCDPVAQDCEPGLGCYHAGVGFQCIFTTQNIPEGQPCGYVNDCAPGLVCLTAEVLPACNGSACCGRWCDHGLGDAQCETIPGTTCERFFEEGTAPSGYEHVGVCILP